MNGQEGSLIWGQRYSRELNDIFAVEDDIARQVAYSLRLQLTSEESDRLAETGTKNPEAYQTFLRAEYHASRWEVAPQNSDRMAIPYFEEAVELDPDYQEPHRRLMEIYFNRARIVTASEEDYNRAKTYLKKIVEIDDSTALGHWAKGSILFRWDREWGEAEAEFKRAVEIDSAIEGGKWLLDWIGRREGRITVIERELGLSDPLSTVQQVMIGYAFLWSREYDRAMEQAEMALALDPQYSEPYLMLYFCYGLKGMEQEAFDSFVAAVERDATFFGSDLSALHTLRERFDASGVKGLWEWELDFHLEQPVKFPYRIAVSYALLGEKDQAFEWLERLWELPLWGYEAAPSSPVWDSLRDDPRFEQLLRKLNLPEEAIQRHLAAAEGTP